MGGRVPANHDDVLEPLRGKPQLDRDDMAVVVAWKFISMGHRKANATRFLTKESDERIEDITQRPLACNDDLGALLIVDQPGRIASRQPPFPMRHAQRRTPP